MSAVRTRAFTMVEVLVVIAIIVVLASVLVPVSGYAQSAAQRAQCMAHLRQMTLAATSWALEHQGAFPPGLLHGTDQDCLSGDVRTWDWHRQPNGDVRPGLLWRYVSGAGAHEVLTCPTASHVSTSWSGDPVTGYNYNVAFIAGEARSPAPDDKDLGAYDLLAPKANLDGATHLTLAQCRRGASVALFGVGGRRDATNKFMRSPVNTGPEYDIAYAGAQAFPMGSNVGRVDGSVVTVELPQRGQYADDLPAWIVDQLDFPRNGFLSEDASAYDPR